MTIPVTIPNPMIYPPFNMLRFDPGDRRSPMMRRNAIPLTRLSVSQEATIAEINGPDSELLAGYGLYPGITIRLRQRFPSLVIKAEETELAVEPDVAEQILVVPLSLSPQPGPERRVSTGKHPRAVPAK